MRAILSLCDRTGVMVQPWAAAGYECICVDLQHAHTHTEGNITFVAADILYWEPPQREWAMVFAFPPCTDVAVSGARHFQSKGLQRLVEALQLVARCVQMAESLDTPWMLENPVSTISSYWRQPDYTFHPYEYGAYNNPPTDAYTKKTCLWTGNGFVMPAKRPTKPVLGDYIRKLPPTPERANIRSVTPSGFARAVFEANHGRSHFRQSIMVDEAAS